MEKGRNDITIDKMAVEEVNKLLPIILLSFRLYGLESTINNKILLLTKGPTGIREHGIDELGDPRR